MSNEYNSPPIPEHHKQWFEELTRAFANLDVTLMSCLDAKTGEPRSVICITQREEDGSVTFIPVGHLRSEPNPFEAYIPPKQAVTPNGDHVGQATKRSIN